MLLKPQKKYSKAAETIFSLSLLLRYAKRLKYKRNKPKPNVLIEEFVLLVDILSIPGFLLPLGKILLPNSFVNKFGRPKLE